MTQAMPSSHFAPVSRGYKMHYHDIGEGLPVVFLHGSGQGASGYSNFKQNAQAFVDAGYRVLLPDLIGFGRSSKPDDERYTADFHLSTLKQLFQHLGLRSVVLVGNSLGGALALHYAHRYKDQVSKLILLAPGGLEDTEAYRKMPGIQAVYRLAYKGEPVTLESMTEVLKLQLYDPSQLKAETIQERLAVAKEQPRAVWTTMEVGSVRAHLASMNQPILCFWGAQDQFLPVSGAQILASEAPYVRSLVISRCGHWVMREYPDMFNRYSIGFLNE